jgi:hypothetical protein
MLDAVIEETEFQKRPQCKEKDEVLERAKSSCKGPVTGTCLASLKVCRRLELSEHTEE